MKTRWWLHRIMGCSLLLFLIFQLQLPATTASDDISDPDSLKFQPALRFAHLNSDDGLVQNNVTAILQDHNGIMWFGTQAGLSRYDGYRFTSFQHDPSDPTNSLSNNNVNALYEDRDGMIWVATEGGGINQLDPDTGMFMPYHATPGIPGPIPGDRHFSILQDYRGHLWFGGTTVFGLTDFDPATQSAITFYPGVNDPNGLHGFNSEGLAETTDHKLWVAASNNIARYDLITGSFTNYDLQEFGESRLNVVLSDSRGQVWAGGSNGLYKYNAPADRFDLIQDLRDISSILEAESGSFWLATHRGLYRFDPQMQQIIGSDEPYAGVLDSLSSQNLSEVYQSRSGLIWIGSDHGVDVVDPQMLRFDYYRQAVSDAPSSLASGTIQAMQIAGETAAWFGIGPVLQKVNLSSGEISQFPLKDYGIDTDGITVLLQDHSGTLWIGVKGGRLLQFDPVHEAFDDLPQLIPPSVPNGAPGPPPIIAALVEDAQNQLWIAYDRGGLYRLDETRETIVHYEAPAADAPPDGELPPGMTIQPPITNMSVDHAGNLWLTSINGFYRFDPIHESYQRYRLVSPEGSDTWTESSLEDPIGIIWVAGHDGLIRLDPETETVTNYTTADGLPTNNLVGILQDQNGDLWLSSKKGLSRFTPSTGAFRNYDRFDGLQGNEFNSRAFARAADGRMFFGGTNGLTAFYPQEITDSSYAPPVILDDFELFNQPVQPGDNSPLSQPIWQTDSLTLDHNQNVLSFEFAVLNYALGDKDRFRYRLEGFEDHWNETDSSRRFATYTNLPAGRYTFRVQAANRDGVWSDHEVALALTVLPPWWETTWFRLLAALSLIGLVLGSHQWRVRAIARHNRALQLEVDRQTKVLQARTNELQISEAQLRHAKEAAEAANQAKSAFLANMSHELRSPLNAILGFAQVTSRNKTLPGDVHENLGIIMRSGEHLLALINQVLDLSKIEAGHMTLNETDFDLYRLLNDIEEMFILSADDKRLALVFEQSDDAPRYLTADVTKLRQTLINLVGNAIKFTSTGGVTVRVRQVVNEERPELPLIRLQFEVADTGPGVPPEEMPRLFEAFAQTSTGLNTQEGTGLGLTISRRFVHLMGGNIHADSEVGRGTTFKFDIICRSASEFKAEVNPFQQQIIGLAPGQPRYRIMIVDDKRINRQLLTRLLAPLGFEIREAGNGKEAIDVAQDFRPHLIWMDMRMPVMNGMEATRRLKAMPTNEPMKIIALTASVYEEERAAVIAAGCDDFVRKPLRAEVMFEMMSRHIGARYLFAAEDQQSTVTPEPLTLAEIRSALGTVPVELLLHLLEGTELGDIEIIEASINAIRQHHLALAEALHRLAQRFEFDELLSILKETTL